MLFSRSFFISPVSIARRLLQLLPEEKLPSRQRLLSCNWDAGGIGPKLSSVSIDDFEMSFAQPMHAVNSLWSSHCFMLNAVKCDCIHHTR